MFGNKGNRNKPQNRIDCLIGAGTTIEGNITFSGGLRVVDISNPYSLAEVGYYVPNPGRGQKTVKSNDIYRAENGLLYLIDRLDGLEILESEV